MLFFVVRARSLLAASSRRQAARLLGALLLAVALSGLGLAPVARAQTVRVTDIRPRLDVPPPPFDAVCQYHERPGRPGPPRFAPASAYAPTATFEVTYAGFPASAEAAFRRAVDVWATHVRSSVPIRIEARFEAFSNTNALASAQPTSLPAATVDGVESIYTVAMLEALTGQEVNVPGDADLLIRFNSRAAWHYGPGAPPASAFDFTTTALHEVAHGLGFLGSMDVQGIFGVWGYGRGLPNVYDRYAEDGQGVALLDPAAYAPPSLALADALTGGAVAAAGPLATRAAQQDPGPTPPRLHAPPTWQPGTSYSHLDEAVYPSGDPSELMTPAGTRGGVARLPGPIVCGMFGDMGWPLGPDCASVIPVELTAFDAVTSGDGTVTLTWETASETNNAGFGIEQRAPGQPAFQEVGFVNGAGTTTAVQRYRFRANAPSAGRYVFRLRQVDFDGTTDYSPTVEVTVGPQGAYALVAAGPNPFRSRTAVELVVREAQQVRAQLYNVLGQRVATVFAGEVRPAEATRLEVQGQGLASGVYLMRVVGERFATTRRLTVVR